MRQTIVKNIKQSSDDGYVKHDTTSINTSGSMLLLGWDFYSNDGYGDFFLTFRDFNIPRGSVIEKATLSFNVYQCANGYVESEMKMADENSPPTTYSGFTSLTPLAEFLSLHMIQTTASQTYSNDITEMIQEKIDSENYSQNSPFLMFTDGTTYETSTSGADCDSWDYQPIASLAITFIPPVQITIPDILKFPRIEGFKYQLLELENDQYKLKEYCTNNVLNGSIDFNFTRDIINTCNLTIKDDSNINYLTDQIRIFYTINYDGTIYEFPLGTYMLLSPTKFSDGKLVNRSIFCYDRLYALSQDKITSSITYTEGTNVIDTITSLLDSIGSWVKYNIPSSTLTLNEDMTYEIGRSKLFIINSLLNTINYEKIFCDGNGTYNAIPWSSEQRIVYEFEDNEDSIYESNIYSVVNYANIYNSVVVVANQLEADSEPLVGTRTFEDEGLTNHPLSITSLGRTIVQTFNSEAISQTYVDLRARRELLKMLEIEESISYKHALVFSKWNNGIPNPSDCYKFKNTLLNANSIYKIESFTYNLKLGETVNSVIRRVYTID